METNLGVRGVGTETGNIGRELVDEIEGVSTGWGVIKLSGRNRVRGSKHGETVVGIHDEELMDVTLDTGVRNMDSDTTLSLGGGNEETRVQREERLGLGLLEVQGDLGRLATGDLDLALEKVTEVEVTTREGFILS